MLVIRPVQRDDLDALLKLAGSTTFGLTSLPQDREHLSGRIDESLRALEKIEKKARGESYLFVMEDTQTARVIGTSGIVSKVGGFEPFYAYRIETSVHHSDMLDVHKEVPTLHLVEDHDGPCEIGSLFLLPQCRRSGAGRALSLSRFLFMAENRDHFDANVIAEMRGVIDEMGHSPFWNALGKHFFEIAFPSADYLSVINKRFIADLMPKHPIYVPLLPAEAQQVIGKVHPNTVPARKMLESEGFTFSGMVDIFEAGPILRCARDEIRAVRQSVRSRVEALVDDRPGAADYLVATVSRDFRACAAAVDVVAADGVRIGRDTAEALGVSAGDFVRYVTLRPPRPDKGAD
jgi:arginine N-succinyltransferase